MIPEVEYVDEKYFTWFTVDVDGMILTMSTEDGLVDISDDTIEIYRPNGNLLLNNKFISGINRGISSATQVIDYN